MIDFDEELAKFKPSKEVEDVENVLKGQNTADMTDILADIMAERVKK